MAVVNGYSDIATVKSRLLRSDGTDDATLEAIVTAASRSVDGFCNRRFYPIVGAVRTYTALEPGALEIDDLVSLTALATDISGTRTYDTPWTAGDYDLTPDNAADIAWPYTAIRQRPFTSRWFPTLRRGVQVTGTWGWPSIPAAVAEATVLTAIRLFTRRNAPYGIAGSADLGMQMLIPTVDPDVRAMLGPYRRIGIGAI